MQTPTPSTPRETTVAMVRSIGRELAEIQQAMERCRGDEAGEPRIMGLWIAHGLICGTELLHNLLMETAARPPRISL